VPAPVQATNDFARVDRRDPDLLKPPGGSFEARASFALKFVAFLAIGGVVLAQFPGTVPVATLFASTFSAAGAALSVIYAAVAFGIDRQRPWAVATIRPILAILVITGVGFTIEGATQGRTRLPFEAAVAAWAWFGPRAWRPVPRFGPVPLALVLVTGLLVSSMLFGRQLFGWGGVLDAHEPDITGSVAVDCGSGGLQATITVTYEWTWRTPSPMPSGTDVVVIGWNGDDAEGRPLYLLDKVRESGSGVFPGMADYPSTEMADQVGRETKGSFRWGVRLAEQRYDPGRIVAELRLTRPEAPSPEPLTVSATYIHLGIWRHDAATVTCTW
jgi:hypothetical protein